MAADVIQLAVSGQPINNGNAVVGVDKLGNEHILSAPINQVTSESDTHSKYDNRFDDTTYYTT